MEDSEPGGEDTESRQSERHVKWPLAAIFDLIQGEYGWTDEHLLGLTLGRMKLISKILVERKAEEHRARMILAQEHARAIMSVLPGLAQSKKANRSMRRAAEAFTLLPDDEKTRTEKMPSVDQVERLFAGGRRN